MKRKETRTEIISLPSPPASFERWRARFDGSLIYARPLVGRKLGRQLDAARRIPYKLKTAINRFTGADSKATRKRDKIHVRQRSVNKSTDKPDDKRRRYDEHRYSPCFSNFTFAVYPRGNTKTEREMYIYTPLLTGPRNTPSSPI